jgi:hypothetical protein
MEAREHSELTVSKGTTALGLIDLCPSLSNTHSQSESSSILRLRLLNPLICCFLQAVYSNIKNDGETSIQTQGRCARVAFGKRKAPTECPKTRAQGSRCQDFRCRLWHFAKRLIAR